MVLLTSRALLLAAFLIATPAVSAASIIEPTDKLCEPFQWIFDEIGDTTLLGIPGTQIVNHEAPMDFVSYKLSLEDGLIKMSIELLEAPPRGDSVSSYRYWFGFYIQLLDGTEHYLDVRAHGQKNYDVAPLVAPNSFGNVRWGEIPIAWDGPFANITIPLHFIEEKAGVQLAGVGAPTASSDGPYQEVALVVETMVYSGPPVTDRIEWWPKPFEPIPSCDESVDSAVDQGEVSKGRVSIPVATAMPILALLLPLAVLVRRHRSPPF
jgi:hypothetical protein